MIYTASGGMPDVRVVSHVWQLSEVMVSPRDGICLDNVTTIHYGKCDQKLTQRITKAVVLTNCIDEKQPHQINSMI